MASERKLSINTNDIDNQNRRNDNESRDDAVELSSLGDASLMNLAGKRQRRLQKMRKYCKLISFFGIALCSLLYSLLSNELNKYMRRPFSSSVDSSNGNKQYSIQDMQKFHIDRVASSMARPFEPVAPSIWCVDARLKHEQEKRRPMGLSYLRIPRAASTTLAGINQRIAKNFAARMGFKKNCIRHDGRTPGPYYARRDTLSFLWTFVRDPTDRAMSRIVTSVKNQRGVLHNSMPMYDYSEQILASLKTANDVQFGVISAGRGGFQLQYSMLSIIEEGSAFNYSEPYKVKNPDKVRASVREVVNGYNFIGLLERFDESLVALQLLLGLETNDILYFAVKTREQYATNGKEKVCLKPLDWIELISDPIRSHLESDEWFAQNYGDHLLYQAANMSLDKTIFSIGLKVFSKALKDFRSLLNTAEESCQVRFPCSSNGTYQYDESLEDCYAESTGCGYKCFDNLSLS